MFFGECDIPPKQISSQYHVSLYALYIMVQLCNLYNTADNVSLKKYMDNKILKMLVNAHIQCILYVANVFMYFNVIDGGESSN